MRRICRHCELRTMQPGKRGLCMGCYLNLDVRALYPAGSMNPATAKYARRGNGVGNGGLMLPPSPTQHSPGTPEKVEVMEGRVRDGFAPFHPDDCKDPAPFRYSGFHHPVTPWSASHGEEEG